MKHILFILLEVVYKSCDVPLVKLVKMHELKKISILGSASKTVSNIILCSLCK